MIYLIDDTPGDEGWATAKTEAQAAALEKFGFRRVSIDEWERIYLMLEERDSQAKSERGSEG